MKSIALHGPVPDHAQTLWHQIELYGFVHFTVNTFTGREWGYGDEDPKTFSPTELDCSQWAKAAKKGGLKGLILTAKHHDGFCLWPTKTTTHNISQTSFRNGKGDLVKEFVEACRAEGLECGLYCSPWDRNNRDYGNETYVKLFHEQWRELLSGYGPLFELWFDGANGGDGFYGGAREIRNVDKTTYYRFEELWKMCRELQPNAVMFSDAGPTVRWCGNEEGFTSSTCWAKVRPEGFSPGLIDDMSRLINGEANGTVWRPAECDVSIRPGWFWHDKETPRTGENLFNLWLSSVGRGASMNLNMTPDRRGLVPSEDVVELTKFKSLIDNFTSIDLAAGKGVGDVGHLTDGLAETYLAVENKNEVVIELARHSKISGIRIEEAIQFGQRIESFAVDVRTPGMGGNRWFEFAIGTTIGAQRIFELAPAVGDAVRIRILKSQATPILKNIKVYAA